MKQLLVTIDREVGPPKRDRVKVLVRFPEPNLTCAVPQAQLSYRRVGGLDSSPKSLGTLFLNNTFEFWLPYYIIVEFNGTLACGFQIENFHALTFTGEGRELHFEDPYFVQLIIIV